MEMERLTRTVHAIEVTGTEVTEFRPVPSSQTESDFWLPVSKFIGETVSGKRVSRQARRKKANARQVITSYCPVARYRLAWSTMYVPSSSPYDDLSFFRCSIPCYVLG